VGHVAATGFLGCESVLAHDAVESLLDASGAFAVAAVPGPPEPAVFVAFREKGVIARIGLTTRSSTLAVTASRRGISTTRKRGVAGCEWWGDLMIHDPARNELLTRKPIAGAGEMEELQVAPDGSYLAVSLWTSPYLVRIDPDAATVVDRRFVGAFNWALEPSTDWETIYLARFHARQLLELHARTLEPMRTHRVGYGVRAIVMAERHGRVLAVSTYDGYLYAVDPTGEQPTTKLRLGGWVRDMALTEDGASLVAGGICGVMRVDLDEWLWDDF
jgi:hypothetical protein